MNHPTGRPDASKYMNAKGKYDPFKSEQIRNAYKEEHRREGKIIAPVENTLWNTSQKRHF